MNETILTALISGIVSIVAAFLLALPGLRAFRKQQEKEAAESKKIDAETSKIYLEMAAQAAKREMEKSGEFSMLQKRLDTLEHEFNDVVNILNDWVDGFDVLTGQLKGADISPKWQPNPIDIAKIKSFKKASQ